MLKLFLHSDIQATHELDTVYERAVTEAVELYILSAYLTHWTIKSSLNSKLREFKFIFGQDFGLSKKVAINSVLKWLPSQLKFNFMVAQDIQGFHPKALFWKNESNEYYALIGSSNLTNAAFSINYEANVLTNISESDFLHAKEWITLISAKSIPVSEDWLEKYQETEISYCKKSNFKKTAMDSLIAKIPPYNEKLVFARRKQMQNHQTVRRELKNLIKRCSESKISNEHFYICINKWWSWENENNDKGIGNRFQSRGWIRKGKGSDFQKLCLALQKVFDASDELRDYIVAQQIDWLSHCKVPTRGSVFSELLCQEYPDKYPVLNEPIKEFLKDNKFKAARGSSEGSRYIDLSLKLRALLDKQSQIKNLAELDVLIQEKYRKKNRNKI